jgi:PKD repeat protein
MKIGSWLAALLFLFLFSINGSGQTCTYNNIISDFQKDQLCSPVEVIKWDVSYTDVDHGGTPVTIHFDWDDGSTEIQPTVQGPAGTFKATATHEYVSLDLRCNYHAVATLIVNGVMCTSSPVEVVVTVWDVDNKNGAYVSASPNVYPVCLGEGATMHFDDDTRYNCVPSQEEDNPNETTRWIQWVYGTNHTAGNFMSSDVTIDLGGGSTYSGPWPYTGSVKTLPGPSWGSSEVSLPITVADDNLLGEQFQVELRYWNYCNKYPDGKPPVIDRSVIEIVGFPDPTITPQDTLCEFSSNVILTAATGGGTWSGPGIVNASTGEFSPFVAGPGVPEVKYKVTDGNGCSAEDTVLIVVTNAPDGFITPVTPFCFTDDPYDLEASSTGGTWTGTGITDPAEGIFDPSLAGIGTHEIIYKTDPDPRGCSGTDTATLVVRDLPFAEFLTPDSTWCDAGSNGSIVKILFTGDESSTFELDYIISGVSATLSNQPADTVELLVTNQPGVNTYILTGVREINGGATCETALYDTLVLTVDTLPHAILTSTYDDLCSPVEVQFTAPPGLKKYSWNFGGGVIESTAHQANQIFTFNYADHIAVVGDDTVFTRDDSTYMISLKVETEEGCVDSVTESLTVFPDPMALFHLFPDIVNYPDSTITLTNLSSIGNWEYLWDFGDGSSFAEKEPGTHSYAEYGAYDIELKTFNDHCRDSITKSALIKPPPPVAGFFPDTIGCPPLVVNFTNTTLYADTYIWDFDDNQFSTETNPTHVFVANKEHHVTLMVTGLSGTDTISRTVSVYDRPQADFAVYPTQSLNLKQVFKFENNSSSESYRLWDFGDGSTSAEREPAHIYGDSGIYTVTLIVWSEHQCPDTLVRKDYITVKAGEGSIDFPTAFVWNQSGPTDGAWENLPPEQINTIFRPTVINVKEFKMYIYTRWGEKIFETNEYGIGWDGYLRSGELATEGVYLWKAWVKYVDGQDDILVGDITFLH